VDLLTRHQTSSAAPLPASSCHSSFPVSRKLHAFPSDHLQIFQSVRLDPRFHCATAICPFDDAHQYQLLEPGIQCHLSTTGVHSHAEFVDTQRFQRGQLSRHREVKEPGIDTVTLVISHSQFFDHSCTLDVERRRVPSTSIVNLCRNQEHQQA
jgi:hypothetical protein